MVSNVGHRVSKRVVGYRSQRPLYRLSLTGYRCFSSGGHGDESVHIENPTRCNNVSNFYLIFIWNLTCFGRHTAHHQKPKTALAAFGFAYVEGCWTCSCWTQSARPRTQHDYHHDTKVKPEAATAVIELLMMGGKTPETCWAVNKRQDNKLKNWCIRLVIYLN